MPSLYVLAIGGSGARVVRSLTMLFATGIKPNYFDKVVPILIDADKQNGSLARTDKLLTEYVKSRKSFGSDKYFATEIGKFDEKGENKFVYYVEANKQFENYLNLKSIEPEKTKMLLQLLFSGKTSAGVPLMEVKMDEGFQGNPNIGSLVMSDFAGKFLPKLANKLLPGDEIIFVTSIFGGTGAAGFPAFLTRMKKPISGIHGQAKLLDVPVGSVTLLPYYALGNGEINSAHFAPKTKSALNYYLGRIYSKLEKPEQIEQEDHILEAFYYIADEYTGRQLPNERGGNTENKQDNAACFGELLAALAILDFAKEAGHVRCKGSPEKRKKVVFKQFETITNNKAGIKFETNHLPLSVVSVLKEPLSRLFMTKKFLDYMFCDTKELIPYPWVQKLGVSIQDVQKLIKPSTEAPSEWKILDDFEKWLEDLASNGRQFNPFALKKRMDNPDDYRTITEELNKLSKKANGTGLKELLALLSNINLENAAVKSILTEEVA